MIIVKKKKELIQGVSECFTLTLELQTPFGEEPHQTMILNYIKKELPLSCERAHNRISYLPLISFNSSMGRTHRFLVAFSLKNFFNDRSVCDRVLPLGIAFSAFAEKEMLNKDGYENLICGGYLKEHLFLLIFFDGKLVHWIQERFDYQEHDLNKRIHRLKLFIQQDPFLSRIGDCPISILPEKEIMSFFEKAVEDPFWKYWDLDPSIEYKERAWKRLQNRFILTFTFLIAFFVAVYFLNQFLFPSKELIIAERTKSQLYQKAELQKILDFQSQIIKLPLPLNLNLLLLEIERVIAKETKLEVLKKIASAEGEHYLMNFSAIHFEEASRIENHLKRSGVFKVKKIIIGPVQSTTNGRVTFQMDLIL